MDPTAHSFPFRRKRLPAYLNKLQAQVEARNAVQITLKRLEKSENKRIRSSKPMPSVAVTKSLPSQNRSNRPVFPAGYGKEQDKVVPVSQHKLMSQMLAKQRHVPLPVDEGMTRLQFGCSSNDGITAQTSVFKSRTRNHKLIKQGRSVILAPSKLQPLRSQSTISDSSFLTDLPVMNHNCKCCKTSILNIQPAAYVTLFELMVVNNWPIIMEGSVAATTVWHRFFFLAWYSCCVIVVVNVLVAFLIESFSTQEKLNEAKEKGKMETWRMLFYRSARRLGIDVHQWVLNRPIGLTDLYEVMYSSDLEEDDMGSMADISSVLTPIARQSSLASPEIPHKDRIIPKLPEPIYEVKDEGDITYEMQDICSASSLEDDHIASIV